MPNPHADRLRAPILDYARPDFTTLEQTLTVGEALDQIRRQGIGERVIYFYVVDGNGKLAGVLPTRRLLTAPAEQPVAQAMVRRVAAIPQTATLMEACDLFVLYKFLSFPVVDAERRMVGVVDVSLLTEELLGDNDQPTAPVPPGEAASPPVEMASPAAIASALPKTPAAPVALSMRPNELFELLGFHLAQVREGTSPWRVFRFRFPWLLATISSGTLCALLSGMFEETLARSIVIAFFLTMVLGLNESLSIQAMSVTIQSLRAAPLGWRWFFGALRREMASALLLALGCGATVALIVLVWQRAPLAAAVIGGSISLSLLTATFFGLSVPTLLHALKLDPKIAAGPVTLALADIFALGFYFSIARLVL